MQAFIASDNVPISLRVREVFMQKVKDFAAAPVLSLERAAARLAQSPCDVLVVVLSPNPERALAELSKLRTLTQAHILTVGPSADANLVRRAYRSGASDYVDEVALEVELQAALRRIPEKGQKEVTEETGKSIAVLGPSGGTGASTVAVNLAAILANEHRMSLLVDLRLEANDLASLLDLRPSHTLAELCQNPERIDHDLFERSLSKHASGVRLLPPPGSFIDAPGITAEGVRRTLSWGRRLYPYVVVDIDHALREEQLAALQKADAIVMVIRLDFMCLRNTQRTLEHLDRIGINRDKVHLVVNRFGQPKEVPAEKAEQALGIKIKHYLPDDPKTVNRANNNGIPVVLESPSAKVSRGLNQLMTAVTSAIEGEGKP
jgi:pilus assembly protein CpaE